MKKRMTMIIMITALSLLVVLGFVAQGTCGGVVYPDGPGTDIINVQTAIDGGGVVLLKATDQGGNPKAFDFGVYDPTSGPPVPPWFSPHGVYIDDGVIIKGETINGEMTTINNGFYCIRVGINEDPDGRVEIRDIRFQNPGGIAIYVTKASKSVMIRGNEIITNLYEDFGGTPEPLPFVPGDPTLNAWKKLVFNPNNNEWQFLAILISGTEAEPITGTVIVRDNYINIEEKEADLPEGAEKVWWHSFGLGSMFTSGKVYFKRNEVLNSSARAIFAVANTGGAYVQRNTLELGPLVSYPLGDVVSAWGISHVYGFFVSGDAPDVGGKIQILGNNITCDPATRIAPPLYNGMVGIGAGGWGGKMPSDVSILNNHVSIQDGLVAIDIFDVESGHVAKNHVDGIAWFALQVGSVPPPVDEEDYPTANTIINNNDFSEFTGDHHIVPGVDTVLMPDAVDNRVIKSGVVGGAVGQNFVK